MRCALQSGVFAPPFQTSFNTLSSGWSSRSMPAWVRLSACSWALLSINSKEGDDKRKAIILGACILGLTACGSGGPGTSNLVKPVLKVVPAHLRQTVGHHLVKRVCALLRMHESVLKVSSYNPLWIIGAVRRAGSRGHLYSLGISKTISNFILRITSMGVCIE